MLRMLTPFVLLALGVAQSQPHSPAPVDAAAIAVATQQLAVLVDDGHVLGMVVMVSRGDEVLVHEAFGHRDVAKLQPMHKDSLFRMASNTKAVTAAAVLTLVEAGKVALDDPISRWFPSFADGEAAKITVRQLLTHSSGLRIESLFVQPLMAKSDQHPDAPNLLLECDRFGAIGPAVEPGSSYAYNNPGYNLCAGLVERVSGENFADYCERRFYAPLGMRDTCHHETVADNARMSVVVDKAKDGEWRVDWLPGGAPTVPFVRGSGGMISTAADFTKFARLFVERGRHGEAQLLAAASVEAATHDQIPHLKTRYGFGWAITDDASFSHSGSDGTFVWCNPARRLIGLVLTQTQSDNELGPARTKYRQAVEAAVQVWREPVERAR